MYCLCENLTCGLVGALQRQAVRQQRNIDGDLCTDWCLFLWCRPCALTQMYLEVVDNNNGMGGGFDSRAMREKAASIPVPIPVRPAGVGPTAVPGMPSAMVTAAPGISASVMYQPIPPMSSSLMSPYNFKQ